MGQLNYTYTNSGNWTVPAATKYVDYIAVGGGAGGARPGPPYTDWGRVPTAGGPTTIAGICGGGGQPATNCLGSGPGGAGNWAYGQTGTMNYSGGPHQRANSGYGPYGQGGAGQWRSPSNSAGGGGGGASCTRRYRNDSYAQPSTNISYTVGGAGQQGGTGYQRWGEAGAVYMYVCTYDTVSANLCINPTAMIKGSGDATLCWSSGGDYLTTCFQTPPQSVSPSGSMTVSPDYTTNYTYVVSNPAYTTQSTVTLTIYIPPEITFSAQDNKTTMVAGDPAGVTLIWSVSGDADTASLSPPGTSISMNSSTTVYPTVTTTYTIDVSGNGGVASKTLTITVLQPPTLEVSAPSSVDWGAVPSLYFNATNSDPAGTGITVTPSYYDGSNTVVQPSIQVPNSTGETVDIDAWPLPVTWDDDLPAPFSPLAIDLSITVDGYADLEATVTKTIAINIDTMPDNIAIPTTDEAFVGEEVVTPDVTVTSDTIEVTDIDIPVEIKSSHPIQVEIDDDTIWHDMREI